MGLTPSSLLRGLANAKHPHPVLPRNQRWFPWAYSLYQEGLPALQLWELLLGRTVTLKVLEDNQATILVVRKGYSPKLRHITRTHKVNLSGLSEVFRDEDSAELEYCQTDNQAADIFTKALPPQKWAPALRLLGIRVDLGSELKPRGGAAT